jgi:hypothetical protein
MILLFSSCYFLAIHKQALPRDWMRWNSYKDWVSTQVWVGSWYLLLLQKGGTECNKWVRREDASTAVQSITASSRPGTASRGSVRSLRMITAPASIAARNAPSSLPLKHCSRSVCARRRVRSSPGGYHLGYQSQPAAHQEEWMNRWMDGWWLEKRD